MEISTIQVYSTNWRCWLIAGLLHQRLPVRPSKSVDFHDAKIDRVMSYIMRQRSSKGETGLTEIYSKGVLDCRL
ncbi:hypothetical protein TNCV_4654351 [Trichonephila clavipes]|nr:hypothetical protein TNCV_4654351 [Trichonephila clavipes]